MRVSAKSKAFLVLAAPMALLLGAAPARTSAQSSQPKAQQAVQAAVAAELAANRTDKSTWTYRDHDVQPGRDVTAVAVETPSGTLSRTLVQNGRPLTGSARQQESDRIAEFVHDSSAQAKQRKAGEHDDAQATEMLKMLPDAFVWTVRSETSELLTLDFRPDPDFGPPSMQSRVLAAMAGQMTIARNGNRIRTLRGTLTNDVKFGFGLFGKINQGGTFDVERREVAPGRWQITETHVHIGGHALLFKTIGQQEDEVKTEWKPSPAHNLQEAEEYLKNVQ